jgi:hypothetical protein
MSVITETTTDLVFITEKTATALLYKQPFIVFGAKGFHEYLTSLGFKLYDEIFNYNFDQDPSLENRAQMVVNNIKKICNQDFYKMYNKIKPKLDYNYNRMIEITQDDSYFPKALNNNEIFQDQYNYELSVYNNGIHLLNQRLLKND